MFYSILYDDRVCICHLDSLISYYNYYNILPYVYFELKLINFLLATVAKLATVALQCSDS